MVDRSTSRIPYSESPSSPPSESPPLDRVGPSTLPWLIPKRWIRNCLNPRNSAIALLLFFLTLHGISTAIAEGLWFQEVHYLPVFRTQLAARLGLGIVAFAISGSWLWGNLKQAQHLIATAPRPTAIQNPKSKIQNSLNPFHRPPSTEQSPERIRLPGAMRLWLLALTIGGIGSLLIALLFYHGQVTLSHWYPELSITPTLGPVPVMFRPEVLWRLIWNTLEKYPWLLGGVPAVLVAIAFYPRTLLKAIALTMSVGFSILLSEYWQAILLALHPVSFGQPDPIFHRDMSFYVFQLPVWELLAFWAVGLCLIAFLSVATLYLLSGSSMSQGYFSGFSWPQRRHLYALASPAMGAIALSYWIDRYELLYSPTGVTYGASYTNVVAQLPIHTGLSLVAIIISVYFLVRSLLHPSNDPVASRVPLEDRVHAVIKRQQAPPDLPLYQQPSGEDPLLYSPSTTTTSSTASSHSGLPSGLYPPTTYRACQIADDQPPPARSPFLILSAFYLVATLLGSIIIPPLVQRLVVQPNELGREKTYLEYTIAATRTAFNLEDIDVKIFDPQTNLTYQDLLNNALTINNIRLWDTRPLLETNRQLQRIRLYYEFPDADIDRYTFAGVSASEGGAADADTRQVLVAARELDYENVPDEAKTWVNKHLIYTHGYGFTMTPVNTATDSGLPDYFIRGIEHTASDSRVQQAIPVTNPRIYYGELTDNYILTPTNVEELDYPSGSENVYTTYTGDGGVAINSLGRRLLYGNYLRDWRMMLSNDVTPDTKLLMRRTIGDRVQSIAPFLRYDSDPYLVVADATLPSRADADSGKPSNLFWMIDAYTTSDRYPYSDPIANDFNYIRNSVKVVVDAYHGTVEFYMADATDPIIQAWNQIFPGMFRSLDTMPPELLSHIRYPQDYYQVQSEQLMTYHMTDPRVLYNREDQWRSPQETYGTEQQPLEPYYLLMELPTEDQGEFILLHPYTPAERRNLIAWLAARSDGIADSASGNNHYGKQLLYIFPKQDLVFGPEQIEARINQDPAISEQISLWNRTGSRAIQGNLLVIPIEESLLYIEPIYLEAEQDRLPTLVRVIAVYDNRIAMEKTLSDALTAVFDGDRPLLTPS